MKNQTGGLVTALCELVIGVLLLINPVGFTAGIITVLGLLLIVLGAVLLVRYFKAQPEVGAVEQGLAKGLVSILAGLFCALRARWFIATFPILAILYGVGTLVVGAVKLEWAVDLARLQVKTWLWKGLGALVTLLCAVVILFNPFTSNRVLWGFVGVSLIAEAVLDVLAVVLVHREGKAAPDDAAP